MFLVDDSCLEVVYRMYWLCYHIHTYKKPMVIDLLLGFRRGKSYRFDLIDLWFHGPILQFAQVALTNGIVMGGGASMVVPAKFSVVTEKTVHLFPLEDGNQLLFLFRQVFSMPEASIGLHTDCSFSYILPRLPGYLGELLCSR
ncbi:hypothetical protein GW17_00043040 [Ensete ventricosum]|nr:hypothetical protein GW17_00043040 [Ensete ventricosum]RZR76868.1 hypothetical protein BHM03_00001754 [Ensete ventricosum]